VFAFSAATSLPQNGQNFAPGFNFLPQLGQVTVTVSGGAACFGLTISQIIKPTIPINNTVISQSAAFSPLAFASR
jgi:hypothetical protein